MGAMRVVILDFDRADSFEVAAVEIRSRSRHSRRMLPIQRRCTRSRGAREWVSG